MGVQWNQSILQEESEACWASGQGRAIQKQEYQKTQAQSRRSRKGSADLQRFGGDWRPRDGYGEVWLVTSPTVCPCIARDNGVGVPSSGVQTSLNGDIEGRLLSLLALFPSGAMGGIRA